MKTNRWVQSIWLVLAGFFIGNVELMGLNPLAVGFVGATGLLGHSYMFTYLATLLGVSLSLPMVHTIRYGIMMFGLLVLFNVKNLLQNKSNTFFMSFLGGMAAVIINLSLYYFVDGILRIEEVFLEGFIIFGATMIYHCGITVIERDYIKIVTDSQAAISVVAIATSVIMGMPVEVAGTISFMEAFALFSIMFAIFKFGFGVGISWTVICGAVVATKTGEAGYLTVWLIINVLAYGLLNLMRGSRGIFVLLFGISYYGCGIIYYDFLLDEGSQKALLSALFFFLFAPSKLMLRVDDKVRYGELAENSPEWGRLVIDRVNSLASAFKRIDYTLASDAATGIGFNDVGEIIEGFTNQLDKQVPLRKTIEARIIEELSMRDIQVKNLILLKNNSDRYEIYLTARVRRGQLIRTEKVREIVEKQMNIKLIIKEESRNVVSRNYEVLCFQEKPPFTCQTAVKCISKYDNQVSGDNFYVGDILEGQKLVIIADGMGNGSRARKDSTTLIDALEELLMAGFDKDMSIRLVNSYLADRNKGETFSTLDMLLIDLHTGYGKMYKQGAATTFIRRGKWLEMIKSTSLPMGVVEGAVCEKCGKKFFHNDIIIMVSDGVLESIIVENKEDYMMELLMEIPMDDPEDIAGEIMERICSISGTRLKDDATIVVTKVVKTL